MERSRRRFNSVANSANAGVRSRCVGGIFAVIRFLLPRYRFSRSVCFPPFQATLLPLRLFGELDSLQACHIGLSLALQRRANDEAIVGSLSWLRPWFAGRDHGMTTNVCTAWSSGQITHRSFVVAVLTRPGRAFWGL